MKSLTVINNRRCIAVLQLLVISLYGCDGQKLILTGPVDGTVESSTTTSSISDESVTESTVVIGSAESIAVNDVVVSDTLDNVTSNDDMAIAYIADRAALGPVKIMAVGDSITHGVDSVPSYRQEFTALLQAASCNFTMVGSQLTSENTNGDSQAYIGAHEGYSGHRADHFLTGHVSSSGSNPGIRVSMETYTPDVVLLHLGSNDVAHEQDVSNALTDLENVLNAIYEVKPESLVLIANVIPWFSDHPYPGVNADIGRLGDGVQHLVNERSDPFLKLVDVRSGFTESMMLNDLIHPNARGESHIADAFMDIYQPIANCQSL